MTTQTSVPPTPPATPPGTPLSNPSGWTLYTQELAQYGSELNAFQERQRQVGIVVPADAPRPGGRSDIPTGSGIEGLLGSRYNEVHVPVPGMESYNDVRTSDEIAVWVDANTGLLRFDRLPDGSRLAGRFQNSNGNQYNGYFPPISNEVILPPQPQTIQVQVPVQSVISSPTVSAPTVTNVPPPPVRTINLRDLVTLSSYTIDRQYIKGSLKNIPTEKIRITNNSSEIDISVSLLGIAGVSFNPSTFNLPKASSLDVDIVFDQTVIDSYPEGVSAVNCVMNLTSNAAIVDVIAPIPPVPPPTPVQPVVLPTTPNQPISTPITTGGQPPASQDEWFERRYTYESLTATGLIGSLQSIIAGMLSSISVTPTVSRTIPVINYDGDLPPTYAVTWERVLRLKSNTRYKFTITVDDGIRVFSNGRIILDAWQDQAPTTYTFYVDSGADGTIPMYIEYYNDRGPGTAKVSWMESSSQTINTIQNPTPTTVPIPPIQILPPIQTPVDLPPPTTTVTSVWVDGRSGQYNVGLPPASWVQDPFTGAWYPPDDPLVLRNFNREQPSTNIVPNSNETVDSLPTPVLQPPPPPIRPPDLQSTTVVDEPTIQSGRSGFTLNDPFLI